MARSGPASPDEQTKIHRKVTWLTLGCRNKWQSLPQSSTKCLDVPRLTWLTFLHLIRAAPHCSVGVALTSC